MNKKWNSKKKNITAMHANYKNRITNFRQTIQNIIYVYCKMQKNNNSIYKLSNHSYTFLTHILILWNFDKQWKELIGVREKKSERESKEGSWRRLIVKFPDWLLVLLCNRHVTQPLLFHTIPHALLQDVLGQCENLLLLLVISQWFFMQRCSI